MGKEVSRVGKFFDSVKGKGLGEMRKSRDTAEALGGTYKKLSNNLQLDLADTSRRTGALDPAIKKARLKANAGIESTSDNLKILREASGNNKAKIEKLEEAYKSARNKTYTNRGLLGAGVIGTGLAANEGRKALSQNKTAGYRAGYMEAFTKEASVGDYVGNASIPHARRKKRYIKHLKSEAASKTMDPLTGTIAGGAIGAIGGVLMGVHAKASPVATMVASLIVALGGALFARLAIALRQGDIDEAKRILRKGKIDKEMAKYIVSNAQAKEQITQNQLNRIEMNQYRAQY